MKCIPLILTLFTMVHPAMAELSLREIRTASDTVLVAHFTSTIIQADEVNIADLNSWG
jgi:hypothetical protein